jgi:hypothetical protein
MIDLDHLSMIDLDHPLNMIDRDHPLNVIDGGLPLLMIDLGRSLNVIGRGRLLNVIDLDHLLMIDRGCPLNMIDRGTPHNLRGKAHRTRDRDLPLNFSHHLTSNLSSCLGAVLLLIMLRPLQVGDYNSNVPYCQCSGSQISWFKVEHNR